YTLDHQSSRATSVSLERDGARLLAAEHDSSAITRERARTKVDFRLTRNVTSFIGRILIDGVVSGAVTAANACILSQLDVLKNYLSLFLRDDMLAVVAFTQKPVSHNSTTPHAMWTCPTLCDV